jgi:ABC-type multidrug transport system fused ATPase/permease subunit
MLFVVLVRGTLQYGLQYLNVYLPAKIDRRMRDVSFDYLLRMDLAVVNRSKSGGIQNFVSGYPGRIGQVMGYLGILISNLALLVIYAALMMLISVTLTIVSLLFLGGVFLLQRYLTSGPLRRAGADLTKANENVGQVVYETLGGLSLIRLSVADRQIAARQREATEMLRSSQNRYAVASALITPLFLVTSGALICSLLYIASGGGHDSAGNVAMVLLFLFLLQRLQAPVSAVTLARSNILLHSDALFEFMRWEARANRLVQKNGHFPFQRLDSGIRFRSVGFSYEADSSEALKDVSFAIAKGQMTAIVGPSGAGKSTIVALLGRLYDPRRGAIEVDGIDLREFKIETWRRAIGVVSQNIFLLNDTIERNLTFGLDRQVTDAELHRATELAACSEFIREFPEGYQTLLGERGTRLSGGQQQRLALARAILSDPQVLILDEATSHLDSITERAIQRAVDLFRDGRTLVVIAHRMSTIRRADKIVVMNDGLVIEEGVHGTLMQSRGRYWDMIEHQRLDIIDAADAKGPTEQLA